MARFAQALDRQFIEYAGALLAPINLIGTPASVPLVAKRAYMMRFVSGTTQLMDHVTIVVRTGTGNAAHKLDVGLFDYEGTKIVSTGATAGKVDTAGLKSIDLGGDYEIVAGQTHYLGILSDATPSLLGFSFTLGDEAVLGNASVFLAQQVVETNSDAVYATDEATAVLPATQAASGSLVLTLAAVPLGGIFRND